MFEESNVAFVLRQRVFKNHTSEHHHSVVTKFLRKLGNYLVPLLLVHKTSSVCINDVAIVWQFNWWY